MADSVANACNGAGPERSRGGEFGNVISSTGSTPNNYLFNAEQFDPALGFYYIQWKENLEFLFAFRSGNDYTPMGLATVPFPAVHDGHGRARLHQTHDAQFQADAQEEGSGWKEPEES